MKSFKQFFRGKEKEKYEWISFEADEYVVHVFYKTDVNNFITEAKHKGVPLGGQYSGQLHQTHYPVGQQHIHVYARKKQLFALNKDGTAHDQSHGIRIPNKVAKAISQKFPDVTLSEDNIIESAPEVVQLLFRMQLLNE